MQTSKLVTVGKRVGFTTIEGKGINVKVYMMCSERIPPF
jgi:hypothetical protein